jgi:TP901 family phage tail tape measure protein
VNSQLISISLSADSGKLVHGFAIARLAVGGLTDAIGGLRNQFKEIDSQIKGVGQKLALTSAGMAVSMGSAAKAAGDLQETMNNFATLGGPMAEGVGRMTDEVLRLSTQLPQSAKELSEGLYDLASSGIGAMEDGTVNLTEQVQVLEVAGKAATAGLTTTAVSGRAIAAAMNAYGAEAGSAEEISDIFFQTVNSGVITFEQLAQNMGDWVGVASTLGVPLEEASAGLAAITLSGIPAAQAATNLSRVMTGLVEPSDNLKEVFVQLGVATGTELIEKYNGLSGAMQAITGVAGTSIESFTGLFNNINAVEGALALTANEGENYGRVLGMMEDRAGSADAAFRQQAEGMNYALDMAKGAVNRFRVEMGQYYLPVLTQVIDRFSGLVGVLNELPGPIQGLMAYGMAFTTIMTALAGVILLSTLRKRLYVLALKQTSAEFQASRIGALSLEIAQHGLIRTTLTHMGSLTAYTARLSATAGMMAFNAREGSFMAVSLNAVHVATAKVTMGLERVSTAGRTAYSAMGGAAGIVSGLGFALMLGMEAMMEFSNASSKAEASVSEFMSGLGAIENADDYAAAIAAVTVETDAARASQQSYFDNMEGGALGFTGLAGAADAVTLGLEGLKVVLPGIESGLANANAETEEWTKQLEHLENMGHALEVFEWSATFMGGGDSRTFQTFMGENTDILRRFETELAAVEATGGDVNVVQNKYNEILNDLYKEWMINGGVAQDFETQLGELNSETFSLTGATMELTDAQKAMQEALAAVGAVDFAGDLAAKQEALSEFARILGGEGEGTGRTAALAFAQTMVDAGILTADTLAIMRDNADITAEEWAALADATQLSLGEYAAELEESNARLQRWQENVLTVTSRATTIFGAGADDIVGFLTAMGEDGVHLAEVLASGTDEEFQRMGAAILENINTTGPQAGVEMDAAMQIIETAGRLGGEATAQAIADELEVGVGAVAAIAGRYGQVLADGINPVLMALGHTAIRMPALENWVGGGRPGAVLADGGFLPNQATFQPASGTRGLVQWAEPETQGEWFIPRAKNKRNRSEKILASVADDFGYGLTKFADGGMFMGFGDGAFRSRKDIPLPPDFSGKYGFPIDVQAEEVMQEIYNRTAAWIEEHAAPMLSGGIGWQAMMDALHTQFPGLPLNRGFPPGAITATGNQSYHALGRAVDIPPKMNIFDWILQHYGPQSKELIFSPANGRQVRNGSPHMYTGVTRANHWDHIHWAMANGGFIPPVQTYDQGGVLAPGYTMAYNGTGKSEYVSTSAPVSITIGKGAVEVKVQADAGVDSGKLAEAVRGAVEPALEAFADNLNRSMRMGAAR